MPQRLAGSRYFREEQAGSRQFEKRKLSAPGMSGISILFALRRGTSFSSFDPELYLKAKQTERTHPEVFVIIS